MRYSTLSLADCATLGQVDSVRIAKGKASPVESRYYIGSRTLSMEKFAAVVGND